MTASLTASACCTSTLQPQCCEPAAKSTCCADTTSSACGCDAGRATAAESAPLTASSSALPVAIIGAGPVGLAAAAHLIERGEPFVLIEAGPAAGASIVKWGHVRLFSPWRYCVDAAAAALLAPTGWRAPEPDTLPLGADLVEKYLQPLAGLPQIKPHLRLNTRVLSVARAGFDKLKTAGREGAPFLLRLTNAEGEESQLLAKAVIDASGTYTSPNPLGASGMPALGETRAADRITYGIPDVLGAQRNRFADKRVLVVGSGHSAFNVVLDLEKLMCETSGTHLTWAVRRSSTGQMFGGRSADQLSERGELGSRAAGIVARGSLQFLTGAKIDAVRRSANGVSVFTTDGRELGPFDEIVATTGFRPDLSMLSELRLTLDDRNDATVALAPLIDPNVHSCGTVPPHGVDELTHPAEPGFYIVGMKSYGRAPTFLMLTGYEQVRSIAAAIAGDWTAARQVRLVLPESGVCGANSGDGQCCAPAAPALISLDAIGVA